jgi:hypothetical protein
MECTYIRSSGWSAWIRYEGEGEYVVREKGEVKPK